MDQYRNVGGFDMIGSGRTKLETEAQFKACAEVARSQGLDCIVIIGGDDSNTNAAVLAEYFVKENVHCAVIGCPKTIDGDLKNEHIETPLAAGALAISLTFLALATVERGKLGLESVKTSPSRAPTS